MENNIEKLISDISSCASAFISEGKAYVSFNHDKLRNALQARAQQPTVDVEALAKKILCDTHDLTNSTEKGRITTRRKKYEDARSDWEKAVDVACGILRQTLAAKGNNNE